MHVAQPDYRAGAAAGMTALQRWYRSSTGLWQGTGWWNSANALTAVIRYTKLTGDSRHAGVIGTTFAAAQRQHAQFINDYYDDNGWWALAWVAAYDLTRDNRYLNAARTIFARNMAAWNDTSCHGGLPWNTTSRYKNAITNELFLTLAALLHQRTPGDQVSYLTWAQKEWDWFSARGLIGPGGLVNDGLTAACQNNDGTTWTYNQGVILGGLAALFEITGDRAYLTQGESIASAAVSQLTSQGILAEPCEPSAAGCNGDQAQFKGIFVALPVRLLAAEPPAGLPRVHPRQCQFGLGPRPERGPSVRAALGRPVRPGRCRPAELRPRRPHRRHRPVRLTRCGPLRLPRCGSAS